VVVGDDEHAVADPGTTRRGGEVVLARQGMPPLPFDREVGELDAEERRAGNVCLEVALVPCLPAIELVGAVDEAVLDQ
jgi:hypothetical protein